MARTVFLHLGLPKTATTYLQTLLWSHRALLEDQGLRLPGIDRRDHLWSTRLVREEQPFCSISTPHRLAAWDRVRADVAAWSETCVISHEFFAAASAEQARRVVADLAPAEVHLVVTAREPLGLFTASWQESIKNRDTRPMAEYAVGDETEQNGIWSWRTLDLRLVLERWAPTVPDERVHLVPLPREQAPRDWVWQRFAELVGVDPASVDVSTSFANSSMGVAEAETLRRVNAHLGSFNSAIDRGTYIRSFLADERLVPRGGERFWPVPERVAQVRARGEATVAHVRAHGYDVLGDVEDLLVPDDLPERRTPESVTDSEVAEVAVELVGRMLHDVRDLRQERRRLREELEEARLLEDPGLRVLVARKLPALRPLLLRGREDPGTGHGLGHERPEAPDSAEQPASE